MAEEPELRCGRSFESNARSCFRNHSSQVLDGSKRKASRAHEIMLSPQLKTLSPSQINTLIQDLGNNVSLNEIKEIGRRYKNMKRKSSPVRPNLIGMEIESFSCLEMLPKARGGPGAEIKSNIYQYLSRPRMSPGVEPPERWSIFDPPDVIPDEEYAHEVERKPKWSQHKIDTEHFRSRWKGKNQAQLKAYGDSDHLYPILQPGKLHYTTERDKLNYNPLPTSRDNCDLVIQQDKDWDDWLIECRIASYTISNPFARAQFCSWLDQLPDDPEMVDIYHVAFFDGSAMPDGVSSMFLPDLKHLPAPRNMKEESTRMHWHETTQGYICNWGSSNQKRIKAEEKKKDQLRRSAPHRAWLNLPPDSRVVPPNIYLRPAELCDASWILDIVNWYVENSPSSEDTQLWNESDYEKLLDFCRNEKLPFVAAAQRTEVRHSKNQIDPVIGYAYVKYHRYSTNADSQMGELQVFVQKDRQRQHIGRALVDMVLSCYDDIPTKSEDYSFDQTGTVQYGAGYGRSLTTLVCSLAYPSEVQKRHSWLKEWLRKDFNFQEKGIFEGARVKFGASFDICYMARQMDTPHMNEVSKTSLVRQLRWNFDEEDLIDLSSS